MLHDVRQQSYSTCNKCPLGHNFALSEYFFPSKLGILSAYRVDFTCIDKKYSMCKTFLNSALKPVSLLFDQPTYMYLLHGCMFHIHVPVHGENSN